MEKIIIALCITLQIFSSAFAGNYPHSSSNYRGNYKHHHVAKRDANSDHLYYFPIDIPPFSGYHHDKGFAFYYNKPELIPQESVQIPSREYLPAKPVYVPSNEYLPSYKPNYGRHDDEKNVNCHSNTEHIIHNSDNGLLPPNAVTQEPPISVLPLSNQGNTQTYSTTSQPLTTQSSVDHEEIIRQLMEEMKEYIDNKISEKVPVDSYHQADEFAKLREEMLAYVDSKIDQVSQTQTSEFLRVEGSIDQLNSKVENIEQEINTLWKSLESQNQDSTVSIATEATRKTTEAINESITSTTKKSRIFEPRISDK